ncbi:hypothetical protein [Clostridium thermarum]|uniref:glycan biosynthesis hexose transferase WsfD n=1 Tax=Clostridium thermarum TaxID=1716543 RepID=UPI0013D09349|nr:hypothetical protein [Clostridium thermarum]
MKQKDNYIKYLLLAFCIIAIGIVTYVLFSYPNPGVADQGDFDRVMAVSGLELTDQDKSNPDFKRFYDYTVTDYKISKMGVYQFLVRFVSTTMAYLITIISFICKLLGQDSFKTGYLAVVYGAIYIFSMAIILKYINLKSKITLTALALIGLVIFLDGNYLLWFNSLYGEPMMITTLMLYMAAWLYYTYQSKTLKDEKKRLRAIIFLFIAAFLFLGSKMQVITAVPVMAVMLGKVLWESRRQLKGRTFVVLCFCYFLLLIYPIQINMVNGAISKDTQYNSVFYGVLKGSKTPEQDLIDLGLNPDMAVEAGKHAYLDSSEYVKYVPRTEITEQEFYSKISNGKLAKFYLTHPLRLIQGMEYTAGKAFYTSTSLGKYSRSYSEEPIRQFNRFTLWSSFREGKLPKKLIFIVFICFSVLLVSIYTYVKNKKVDEIVEKLHLLWGIMFIGVLQFPMPYVGNGEADTAKQLYLFNFIFDIILVVSVCWCLDKLILTISKKVNK